MSLFLASVYFYNMTACYLPVDKCYLSLLGSVTWAKASVKPICPMTPWCIRWFNTHTHTHAHTHTHTHFHYDIHWDNWSYSGYTRGTNRVCIKLLNGRQWNVPVQAFNKSTFPSGGMKLTSEVGANRTVCQITTMESWQLRSPQWWDFPTNY